MTTLFLLNFLRIRPPTQQSSRLNRCQASKKNQLERLKCNEVIRTWRKRRNGVRVKAVMQSHWQANLPEGENKGEDPGTNLLS